MKSLALFFAGAIAGIAMTIAMIAVLNPPTPFHYFPKSCIISDVDPANYQVFCNN